MIRNIFLSESSQTNNSNFKTDITYLYHKHRSRSTSPRCDKGHNLAIVYEYFDIFIFLICSK